MMSTQPAMVALSEREMRISKRNQARVEEAIRNYFAALAYTSGQDLERLVALVTSRLPATASPGHAVAAARGLLDSWLRKLTIAHVKGPTVTLEMCRAALIAIDVGKHWPTALLTDGPATEFLTAFYVALPIALPPKCGLSMPRQSFKAWGKASPRAAAQKSYAVWRRCVMFALTFATTSVATYTMARVFSPGGISAIEGVLMVLFALNFFWIALTMWTGLLGLIARVRGRLPDGLQWPAPEIELPRTAVLIPAYNEDPVRIFSAVTAIYKSLRATGHLAAFDFFVLSDSTQAAAWIAEEILWDQTRRRLRATGRLFYRRRFENTARKAGNIAEFCERWGGHYEAMLVLDADSLMEGETIVQMVRVLAANPHVGLLQTIPQLINKNTLFARAQQFAGRVYGPVLASGLAEWYGGDANYWGHNALIRVRAFADHAGMPTIDGRPPFGGHILSHDFVEAALMRRAGWGVYLLPQLGGSFEESPPSLLDHAQRDRRWCQGNLQHLAVIGAAGLHPLSRFHLATGIMAYLASPLWLGFIVVGILAALQTKFELPQYFFPNRTPYPVWQVIDSELAINLFGATLAVLLAPKFFGWLAIAVRPREAALFGGRGRALLNVAIETLFSALLAPVQMLFQSRFVFDVLLGRDSGWKTQARDEHGIPFKAAWQRHKHHCATGLVLAIAAYTVNPWLLAWMMPALVGMMLAAPVSYVSSRLNIGLAAKTWRWLLIPEEVQEPEILRRAVRAAAQMPAAINTGLTAVIHDNRIGNLHLALLSQYAPALASDAMAIAHYRAHNLGRRETLDDAFDQRLQVGALADRQTVRKLRRERGKFRE